jgi:hypothetical protein
MKRYVYAFDSVIAVQAAVNTLLEASIPQERIALIARTELQSASIPPDYLDSTTDFAPAIIRGAAIGSATGLVVGIVAMLIPNSGIVAGMPAVLAFLAGGAILGAWSSAMIGSEIPDAIRRKFDDEIEAGRVLLIVDSDTASNSKIRRVLFRASDPHLLWQGEVRMPK